MLSGIGVEQVYLACVATDLRKSIDALAVIVQIHFALDPFAPALFVFCNRQRDKLKSSTGSITASGYSTVVWNAGVSVGHKQMKVLLVR